MDADSILSSLVGSGPVAIVLFYWVWNERKERLRTTDKLIGILEQYAGLGEATRERLNSIDDRLDQVALDMNKRGD